MAAGQTIKRNRFLLCLSAFAFCVLFVRPLQASWIIAPFCTGVTCWLIMQSSENYPSPYQGSLLLAGMVDLFLAFLFVVIWLRTKRLVSLQFFNFRKSVPVLITAVICTPCAVPFTQQILKVFCNSFGQRAFHNPLSEGKPCFTRKALFLVFAVALAAVSICSMSSPLYPFNDWVDANCFFTVGKSMLYGLVPYRDLYEQKGPLLYAIYALCYPVSHTSFLGAWLLEIISGFFFLLFSYKTFYLITGRKSPLFLFLTAAIVYTAPSFLKGGSAEELCLPLLMVGFYYGAESILCGKDLSVRQGLLIGLTSGAVFWIKYSILGFYLGFILIPAWKMLRSGKARNLLCLLLSILTGVVLVSLPVLLYFWMNGALDELWRAYFYNNIFVYGKSSSLLQTVKGLLSGAASMLTFNDATILLFMFSFLSLMKEKRYAFALYVLFTFAFAFGVIYAGGINLKYYSEILCIFVPVGLAQLWKQFPEKAAVIPKQRLFRIALPLLLVVSMFGTENNVLLFHQRSEMPQFIFNETLKESPGATLFNYGALDIGQYTVSDIVPSCRYFCMLNLPSEEMFREMEHYMADGVTDYIVSRGLEVDSPHYKLLQTVYFTDNNTVYPYYLYKNRELS